MSNKWNVSIEGVPHLTIDRAATLPASRRLEDMEITVSMHSADSERHKATFVYDFDESLEEMFQRIQEYVRLRTWHFDNEPRDRDEARLYDALTELHALREQNDALMKEIDLLRAATRHDPNASWCPCERCAARRAGHV